jgi:hypothetical protein
MIKYRNIAIISFSLLLVASFSCSNVTSSRDETTSPITTSNPTVVVSYFPEPTLPDMEDIHIINLDSISIVNETGLVNPGGPIIDIQVMNKSEEPIVSLTMSLDLGASINMAPTPFTFDLSADHPLMPGGIKTATSIAIGGGYAPGALYMLTIEGILQGGKTFTYVQGVGITIDNA